MAWTAPMTAVTGNALTAAQFNTHVRNNLLETAPAKISAAGDYVVATGANALGRRQVGSDFINTSETTSSTTFVNLATVGPTVTVQTGPTAMVWWSSAMYLGSATSYAVVSVAVSGATTIAADDEVNIILGGVNGGSGNYNRWGGNHLFTGLTPGTNTFQMKYRSGSGTNGYSDRELIVMPF